MKPIADILALLKKTVLENGDVPSKSELLYEMHLLEKKKQAARIPKKHLNATFQNFHTPIEDRRSVTLAKQWGNIIAEEKAHPHFAACCITGNNGNGKTHLGIALLACMGYDGLYFESEELVVRVLRARSYKASISEEMMLKSLIRPPLIIMDEIGRGQNAEVEQHLIFKIVNMRYKCNKPIVLISNKSRKELQDFIGKAVVDRISERPLFVELTAESRRPKIARGNISRSTAISTQS